MTEVVKKYWRSHSQTDYSDVVKSKCSELVEAIVAKDKLEDELGEILRKEIEGKTIDEGREFIGFLPECMAKFDLISLMFAYKEEGRTHF
jgi:hypothetical protein